MSGKKLYVGNISFRMTDDDLAKVFGEYGTVTSATMVMDRETGRPRGFGFVEMATDEEAQAAVAGLDGAMIEGRNLRVNVARPREDRGGGGGARGPRRSERW
jgi:RNA recognition motif-containing protein